MCGCSILITSFNNPVELPLGQSRSLQPLDWWHRQDINRLPEGLKRFTTKAVSHDAPKRLDKCRFHGR
jgi:hypothetical protein